MANDAVSTAPNMANGFVKHLNTKLFSKIVTHPKIVVAREHINRYALVGPLREPALKAGKALGYGMLVFKPKVKNVADEVERRSAGLHRIHPGYKGAFALCAGRGIGCAQVQITRKKN